MKCVLSVLFMAVCAAEFITAIPVRNGMVFYQSNPGYYDNHRAFVMQYASQPVRSYRRNGIVPTSTVNGVSAFVAGKKISTGTIVKQQQSIEEQDELPVLDGAAHSVATAFPEEEEEVDEDVESSVEDEKNYVPEDVPSPADDLPAEQPTSVGATKKKLPRKPVKPVLAEEEDEAEDDEEDEQVPAVTASRTRKNQGGGPIYFPVHFGSTNGGAIAVANSYSTGKGGSASSHATAYGSPSTKSKAKKSSLKKKN